MGFTETEVEQTNQSKNSHHNPEVGEEVLPVTKRKIRDVIFLLLFLAFVISLFGLVIYASSNGDLDRLTHGVDKYGNICGDKNKAIDGAPNSGQDLRTRPYAEATDLDGGSVYYNCTSACSEDSTVLFYRCIPKQVAALASSVGEVVSTVSSSSFLQESVEDIEACWREIIFLCLIALAMSIIITVLLRFVAGIIVWISIGLAIVASLAGTGYLWYCYYDARRAVDNLGGSYETQYQSSVNKWLAFAIIATIGTLMLILMIIFMRNRIRLVVALFQEAGKAITSMPFLLLQPIWTFFALVLVCTAWVYGLLWIESAGMPVVSGNGHVTYQKNTAILFSRWYHLFGLLWLTQFVLACQDFVIGGAVTQWYFAREKSSVHSPILVSIRRLLCFHVGSIALGSLIIAIVKAIRIVLKYIEHKLSSHSGATCARCVICAVQCLLYCFENFLKFLSRNAYVEIAIFGISFCEGAKRAFRIITNNALRVAAINSVGDFVLMLSKLGVVLAVIFIGIEIIKAKAGVHHIWVPILLCALFGLLTSHCFLTVYEMSIDTLLVCFCEDCDMNDGVTKPYFMNTSLMVFVKNSKKELSKLSANTTKVAPAPDTLPTISSTVTPDPTHAK